MMQYTIISTPVLILCDLGIQELSCLNLCKGITNFHLISKIDHCVAGVSLILRVWQVSLLYSDYGRCLYSIQSMAGFSLISRVWQLSNLQLISGLNGLQQGELIPTWRQSSSEKSLLTCLIKPELQVTFCLFPNPVCQTKLT